MIVIFILGFGALAWVLHARKQDRWGSRILIELFALDVGCVACMMMLHQWTIGELIVALWISIGGALPVIMHLYRRETDSRRRLWLLGRAD